MSYVNARDKRAIEGNQEHADLMCAAHGCPNIWTTLSTKLCRWHSAAELHAWPRVTEELQQFVTDAAIRKARPDIAKVPLTREDKQDILNNMRLMVARQRVA